MRLLSLGECNIGREAIADFGKNGVRISQPLIIKRNNSAAA